MPSDNQGLRHMSELFFTLKHNGHVPVPLMMLRMHGPCGRQCGRGDDFNGMLSYPE